MFEFPFSSPATGELKSLKVNSSQKWYPLRRCEAPVTCKPEEIISLGRCMMSGVHLFVCLALVTHSTAFLAWPGRVGGCIGGQTTCPPSRLPQTRLRMGDNDVAQNPWEAMCTRLSEIFLRRAVHLAPDVGSWALIRDTARGPGTPHATVNANRLNAWLRERKVAAHGRWGVHSRMFRTGPRPASERLELVSSPWTCRQIASSRGRNGRKAWTLLLRTCAKRCARCIGLGRARRTARSR